LIGSPIWSSALADLAAFGLAGKVPRDTAGFIAAAYTLFDSAASSGLLADVGYDADKLNCRTCQDCFHPRPCPLLEYMARVQHIRSVGHEHRCARHTTLAQLAPHQYVWEVEGKRRNILSVLSAFVSPVYAPSFRIVGVVIGLLAGGLEEIGWTGFATPRLLDKHNTFMAGLILGRFQPVPSLFTRLYPESGNGYCKLDRDEGDSILTTGSKTSLRPTCTMPTGLCQNFNISRWETR
jgi:hypothetical protein